MSSRRFFDLYRRGSILRLLPPQADSPGALQILRELPGREPELMTTFRCPLDELGGVVAGATIQVASSESFLLIRRSQKDAWFVFSVKDVGLDGSRLVPISVVEEALGFLTAST
jgi:hypothetical protein